MKKADNSSIKFIFKLSPKLKKIVGAVKLPANFDEEQELYSYFENKHSQLRTKS